MNDGLLPIGSVVLLTNSTKRVMIIGFCQQQVGEQETIWDYAGCIYPEGYFGPDKTLLFNHNQIERIYSLGYQDEEQFEFIQQAETLLKQIREKQK